MANIIIPTAENLTNDNLRGILLAITSQLTEAQNQQKYFSKEIEEELKTRPTLQQTISAFAETPPSVQNPMMYVDIYSVHGIVSGLTNKILTKLEELSINNQKYEQLVNDLITKVGTAVKAMELKCKKSDNLAHQSLVYARRNLIKLTNTKKIGLIFQELKRNAESHKNAQKIVKKRLKIIEKSPLKKSIEKWKKILNSNNSALFKGELDSTASIIRKHQDSIDMLEKKISSLQQSKVNNEEISDIKEFALKADLRVLFQDLKRIISVHSQNTKTKCASQMATFQDSLENLREEFKKICEEFSYIKSAEMTKKLKSEVADLNKHYVTLSDRIVKTDQSSKVEESDFRISLMDRKLEALELRVSQFQEEKSMEGAFSNVIKGIYSAKRPTSSYPKGLSSSLILYDSSPTMDQDTTNRPPRTAPGKSRAPTLFKTTSRRKSNF